MDTTYLEDQISSTVEDLEPIIRDDPNEADSSTSCFDQFRIFNEHGMMRLEEGDLEHDNVVRCVQGSLGRAYKGEVNVLAVHKNGNSSLRGRFRLGTFRIYVEAVAKKCGGDANVKDAWYGGSKDEICGIISNGFMFKNDGFQGIQLSPVGCPFQSVISAVEDDNGMRHILLCQVILGDMKIIQPGTEQFQPGFESFDSGVDSLLKPRKYIIWSAYMNSHISPNYVISFKLPENIIIQQDVPKSPHMRMNALLNVLSNYLHPSQMANIGRYHKTFLANKISRDQLVKHIRLIAGDNLLRNVIRSINSATSDKTQSFTNRKMSLSGDWETDMKII